MATRTLRLALRLFLVMSWPLGATAQELSPCPTEIDPVAVSPHRFKVLLENPHVRVVEYTLLPGQRDPWHTHPPKVSYVVSGGTLRITTEDGRTFLARERKGAASWMDALGRHFAENVGKTPVRILLVEVKDVP